MVLGISHAVVMMARGAECSRMRLFHETGLAIAVGINLCGKLSKGSSKGVEFCQNLLGLSLSMREGFL